MDVQNKNGIGNPHHDHLGRFARASGDSSGDSKNQYLLGHTWEELKHLNVGGNRFDNKQAEFIEVNFTSPIIKKLMFEPIKKVTSIKDIWEPSDWKQKLDKRGIDVVAELEDGTQRTIDLKVATGHFGKKVDLYNPTFNMIMFRYDKNVGVEVQGYLYKDNETDIIAFTEMDVPYSQEQLFYMGEDRTLNKNINGISMFLTNKIKLQEYINNNFDSKEEQFKRFQELKQYCIEEKMPYADYPIKGKDGTRLIMHVNRDKQTGGFACTLRIDGNTLREKCSAIPIIRRKRTQK